MIAKWKRFAIDLKSKSGYYPKYYDLVVFVNQETRIMYDPVLLVFPLERRSTGHKEMVNKGRTFASQGRTISCYLYEEEHPLYACAQFKILDSIQRLKIVRDRKLCENCFFHNHATDTCFRYSKCEIDGCQLKHFFCIML